jgi:hypothetical protein
VDGVCTHEIQGFGASCSADGAMQCVSGGSSGVQCCPTITDPTCTTEGTQGECDPGSLCLEGGCWLSCDPASADPCVGTPWTTCGDKTVGDITIHICQ